MKKIATNTSIATILCACFALIMCFCANSTVVASATETKLEVKDIISMVSENNGTLFINCNMENLEDFKVCDVIEELKSCNTEPTETSEANEAIDIPQEFISDFQMLFSNTENQKLSVYEDIITGEVTVKRQHPLGYGISKFSTCHAPEDINHVIVEFNYLGFAYTVYVNSMDEESCIAKKWDPIPYTKVYTCAELDSDVEQMVLKKQLQTVFGEGEDIHFIQEANNGRVHGYVCYNGEVQEYIFEGYNQNPIGEELPEIILGNIEADGDEYSIIVEDGKICIESAKRSGWLDWLA